MSDKIQLSFQRDGQKLNKNSKKQEKEITIVVNAVLRELEEKHGVKIVKEKEVKLQDIINYLSQIYTKNEFHYHFNTSSMKPDGGILYLLKKDGTKHPILIAEMKNQGTNDVRVSQGMKEQSKGNAIERLGKNVIGFRTFCIDESIFPFVCFGYGCDFKETSSILDRVTTIAMFGKINKTYLYNEGSFNRGSFYFREEKWEIEEMYDIVYDIAEKSIFYYFSKYGSKNFK